MDNPEKYNTVDIRSLVLGYGGRTLTEPSTLGFCKGEFTALIGRNGTGKSTLLRAIAGLMKPVSGEIEIEGRPVGKMTRREVAEKISLVSTEDVRVENLKVFDVVALGRAPYTNWAGSMTENDRHMVDKALRLVKMDGFEARSMHSLSDGERQRVMIARALAQDTDIILLDEPTAFLDISNKYDICLLLGELAHRQDKCIICSTHDLNIALELCDKAVMIAGRRFHYGSTKQIVEDGTIQKLFDGTNLVFDKETRNVKLNK